MTKSTRAALEGNCCDTEEVTRGLLEKVKTSLNDKITSLDAAYNLLQAIDAEKDEISSLLTSITNAINETKTGAKTVEEAKAEITPYVTALKEKCDKLGISSAIAADPTDVCDVELAMLREVVIGTRELVTEHIAKLRELEGSEQDGKAATLTHGVTESYNRGGSDSMNTMLSFMNDFDWDNDYTSASEADEEEAPAATDAGAAEDAPVPAEKEKKGLQKAWAALREKGAKLWKWIQDRVKDIKAFIVGAKDNPEKPGLLGRAKKAFDGAVGGLKNIGGAIKRFVVGGTTKDEKEVEGITGKLKKLKDDIQARFNAIKEVGKGATKSFGKLAHDAMRGIGGVLSDIVKAMGNAVGVTIKGLFGLVGNFLTLIASTAKAVMYTLGGGKKETAPAEAETTTDAYILNAARSGDYSSAIEALLNRMNGNETATQSARTSQFDFSMEMLSAEEALASIDSAMLYY